MDMAGLGDMNYERSSMLWKKKALGNHLQRVLEYVLSNAVWTRERRFRHTNGVLESSPKCKFCGVSEDETPEHIYWKCKKWEDVREQFPLARKVYEDTRHTVTKVCGLVLRSEDNMHSDEKVAQMQSMMATILQARFAAGKQDALQNDPGSQGPGVVAAIRPHDLAPGPFLHGRQTFECLRCGAFRSGSTQRMAQEHCDGPRRQHRQGPRGPI